MSAGLNEDEMKLFPLELRLREKQWWDTFKNKEKLEDQSFGNELFRDEIEPGYVDTATFMRPRVKVLVSSAAYSHVKNETNLFTIKMSVEQYSVDGIRVKVEDNTLVVNCKHGVKEERSGSVSREFTRNYVLPDTCDTNDIKAFLDKGILTITVPKKDEPIKREIEIAVNYLKE